MMHINYRDGFGSTPPWAARVKLITNVHMSKNFIFLFPAKQRYFLLNLIYRVTHNFFNFERIVISECKE